MPFVSLYESTIQISLDVRESEALQPNNSFLQTVTTDDLGLNPEPPGRLCGNPHTTPNG